MKNSQQSGMRKKTYISHQIQGSLLLALIVFEVILISLAILYLYFRFNDIMDQQIYTIHRTQQHETLILIFMELIKVIIILSIINIFALFIVHVFWDHYIKKVLSQFRNELKNIQSLDFRELQKHKSHLHEVVGLVQEWKFLEQQRCLKLSELFNRLEKQIDTNTSHEKISQTLNEIDQTLP